MIVGAGLAGCVLAQRMEAAGQPFKIIGSSTRPSAARVAAGIINPVTGRWMTKSWRFDDFAPEAASFYRDIEKTFSIKVYHTLPAVRFCLNKEDVRRARRRCKNPRYADVLDGYQEPEDDPVFKNPHGSFRINGVAYVNLPLLIEQLRAHYRESGQFEDAEFAHDKLERSGDGWCYGGELFERVIFCEGAALKENPWFGDLPLTPAKGETLLCRSESLKLGDELYHHGKWLLPYPDGTFRIGATYDEADLTPDPTDAAGVQLRAAFEAMTKESHLLEQVEQLAGLRPSTCDARPFLGVHSKEPSLYIFNGLGSKGASLAPTLSRELMDFIFKGKALDPETDIRRFG